eukprot:2704371-Amphidinium_carterae.1
MQQSTRCVAHFHGMIGIYPRVGDNTNFTGRFAEEGRQDGHRSTRSTCLASMVSTSAQAEARPRSINKAVAPC